MKLKKSGNKFCLDKISQDEMECLWVTLHTMYADVVDNIGDNHTDDEMIEVPIGFGVYAILTDELKSCGFFDGYKVPF